MIIFFAKQTFKNTDSIFLKIIFNESNKILLNSVKTIEDIIN